MAQVDLHPCIELFEREITRFQRFAVQRSRRDRFRLRRDHKRYHRSWPLLVATYDQGRLWEHSAALHDASENGVGFMCDHFFAEGACVYIQLFWHEASALRIPAVVRHTTPGRNGFLVGCRFCLSDFEACETALHL